MIFMSSGTTYLIFYNTFGEEYVGETDRLLWVRIKEHTNGKHKVKQNTPLVVHGIQRDHGEAFEVEAAILAQELETGKARKTLELSKHFR